MCHVHDYSSYVRRALVHISRPVARKLGGGAGGSINSSECIYPGEPNTRAGGGGGGGGGMSVRSPSRLAGQIRKARHLRA